jgi:hypothetical protein
MNANRGIIMAKKQTELDAARRIVGTYQEAKKALGDYQSISQLWLSGDEDKKKLCGRIITDKVDGGEIYQRLRSKIADPAALELFDYFVGIGEGMYLARQSVPSANIADALAPIDVASMVGRVMGHVGSLDTRLGDIQQQLEEVTRERDALRPYKSAYVEMVGELETEVGSGFGNEVDKLLNGQ